MKAYVFPGQGSQYRSMGGTIFDDFAELTEKADDILGYSIKKLCQEDPLRQLNKTQFTQPAIYVVSCLSYLKKKQNDPTPPDYLAGHSLGEYCALFAAGAFDFSVGLKLVKKRGELMSQASGGTMAAVMGCDWETVEAVLRNNGLHGIDIANYNCPTQTVLSGPTDDILKAETFFNMLPGDGLIYYPLNVSAPFHSRYMSSITPAFVEELEYVDIFEPKIPVIANVSARPYEPGQVKSNLAQQIQQSVQWTDTVRYLLGKGVTEFEEIGPGDVLTKTITRIREEAKPLFC